MQTRINNTEKALHVRKILDRGYKIHRRHPTVWELVDREHRPVSRTFPSKRTLRKWLAQQPLGIFQ